LKINLDKIQENAQFYEINDIRYPSRDILKRYHLLFYFKTKTKNHDKFSEVLLKFKNHNNVAIEWWAEYFWIAFNNLFNKYKPDDLRSSLPKNGFTYLIRPLSSAECEEDGYFEDSYHSLGLLGKSIQTKSHYDYKSKKIKFLEGFFVKYKRTKNMSSCRGIDERKKELAKGGMRIDSRYLPNLEDLKEKGLKPLFIIIDDVFTTGSTTNMMAELIQKSCPSKIIILTLERTLESTKSNINRNYKIAGYK
jgi:hypothetical protein